MTDLTPQELVKLVRGATEPAPFDGDTFDKAVAVNRRRECQAELETFRLLLQQRQTIALERLADHLAGTEQRSGLVDAIYDSASPNR
jgi:hypothetical protein